VLAIATAGTQMFLISPVLKDIAETYSASPATVGIAVSAGSLGTALAAALAVPLIDRLARRTVLIAAMLALAATLAAAAAAPSLVGFGIAFALAGAATGVVLPTTYAIAGDLAGENERARLLSLVLMGWSLSFFLQPVASVFGDTLGWRGAYGLIAALAIASAVMALLLPHVPGRGGKGATLAAYGGALAVPAVKPLLLACLCFMFAFYGVYPYWGTAFRLAHGGDAAAASLLSIAYGTGYVVMALSGRWIDRVTSWRATIMVFAALVAAYGVLGTALTSEWLMIGWCCLLGFLNNAALSALVGSFASVSAERRGAILAIYSATTYVGFTIGASTMGSVFERYGLAVNGLAAAGAMLLAVGLATWAWRVRRRS
jgi:predicted MFS family arabinose efflux permease